MPTAREALLDTADTALAARPWPELRMREVAAGAGVSRQTLYNEFGSKDGLGRSLIGRAADGYLAGVEEALATHALTGQGPVELALWTVRAARGDALVKACSMCIRDSRRPPDRPSGVALGAADPLRAAGAGTGPGGCRPEGRLSPRGRRPPGVRVRDRAPDRSLLRRGAAGHRSLPGRIGRRAADP
ncbi:TetR/AcrR family transcriptional regulator [Streptomyces sp. NRRL WC-3549]|uniref:TetR/AcrR family transcriptional regulator n=1 Tax=Streptomyces sp. NRRL WC-3549 TaxID=1463925 RepID=UPI000A9CF939|nr:helix-turn-helix domain-containing protein [Streptomyces sp. NRRL WC-3549]